MENFNLNSVQFIDWADRYLNGQLTIDETTAFENLLATNPAMFSTIEQHQQLIDALALFDSRTKLKAQMSDIHTQYSAELNASANNISATTHEPSHNLIAKVREIRPMRIYLAAASVAVVVSLSIISGYNYFETKVATKGYKALRRDLEKIKKSQHVLINSYNNNNGKDEPIVERFGGTGFALTSSGLIVTSYHLIKDNDSVFIENNKVGRLKVIEVYSNPAADISVLKIADKNFDGFGNLPYTFANKDNDLGEKVFTLGYPREDVVYGEGSISSHTGFDGDTTAYQISIPVNPGNSGGPLVDEHGNIIGLISGKQTENEGAAFAIKSFCILQSVDALKNDTSFSKLNLSKRNALRALPRVQQLKKLQDFVFVVKVFNKNF